MRRALVPALVALVALAVTAAFAAEPIKLKVDLLTTAPLHLIHATMRIPASPGALTLRYAKWLPGEHGPTGPIKNLAGMFVRANGADIAWRRDPKDMFAFHVDVPAGASEIEVALDLLAPAEAEGFSSSAFSTQKLALLSWNQVILYPEGRKGSTIMVEATLGLPGKWSFATALPVRSATSDVITFAPVSLTTLIDSPVLTGQFMKTIVLDERPGRGKVVLDLAADGPAALAITPETENGLRRLVAEADALFGTRHFESYHFLLTLSDTVAHFGLEHHESSDDRVRERSLVDPDQRRYMAGLLPHEYVHSWNGKYRRPADLLPDDFDTPIDSNLLWVYEGLTQYLGWVLAGRSGLRTVQESLDDLARTTAELDATGGRVWRPLEDTAVAAQLLYETPDAWTAWRRSTDFYDEGTLIWLEADVKIRALTKGARSLDDFCKRFHGGGTGRPEVATYRLQDVVAALDAVAPFDWAAFLDERIRRRGPRAPTAGIEAGGWRLGYASERSPLLVSRDEVLETVDARYSIGLLLDKEGAIVDVVPDSTAWKARAAPGMKIIGVEQRRYTKNVMRDLIRWSGESSSPIRLLLQNGDFFREISVEAVHGERYPILERAASAPDVLGSILAPRSKTPYNSDAPSQKR